MLQDFSPPLLYNRIVDWNFILSTKTNSVSSSALMAGIHPHIFQTGHHKVQWCSGTYTEPSSETMPTETTFVMILLKYWKRWFCFLCSPRNIQSNSIYQKEIVLHGGDLGLIQKCISKHYACVLLYWLICFAIHLFEFQFDFEVGYTTVIVLAFCYGNIHELYNHRIV